MHCHLYVLPKTGHVQHKNSTLSQCAETEKGKRRHARYTLFFFLGTSTVVQEDENMYGCNNNMDAVWCNGQVALALTVAKEDGVCLECKKLLRTLRVCVRAWNHTDISAGV